MRNVSIFAALLLLLGLTATSHGQDSWGNSNDPLSFSDQPAVPNPFDTTPSSSDASSTGTSTEDRPKAGKLQLEASPANQSPEEAPAPPAGSIPGGQPVANYATGAFPSGVDYEILAMTPHIRQVPVQWSHPASTPNPVGEIMLREFCTSGLWRGYAAERAAECAHMWKKIEGSRKHCGAGCDACDSGCTSCQTQQPVVNRYRSAEPGCTDCASTTSTRLYQQQRAAIGQPTRAAVKPSSPHFKPNYGAQPQNVANFPTRLQR